MPRCPACSSETPGDSRFCPTCGASLGEPTSLGTRSAPTSSTSGYDEGRFPAGSVLSERYRVLGLLGRGGMGEVYRAFDLKLDQVVALKFLPAATARDPRLLERFRSEVRIARQVSHRNVCRVHDIGEAEGAAFISMEYVDGEDLGSLLRRIGRLPADKALELARRLCAGLAAAHEKGVLHRDLKPANIMIDGRGQLLIMDFGLGAAVDGVSGWDIRSGTPAYMAPEQEAGREVTVRSDIYSLGQVLSEMFTGERASRDGKKSTTVKDLDPAVERVITRCLDPNPSQRPASALDVARALPGGNPLAEALAAGDTPSPQMVAASDDVAVLSIQAAVGCLALIAVGVASTIALSGRANLTSLVPLPDPPAVLARTARDIVVRLGYTDPPADSTYRFASRTAVRDYASRGSLTAEEFRALATSAPTSEISFWYRQSPQDLVAVDADGQVSRIDPPHTLPGMVRVDLDPEGHLWWFDAVPPQEIEAAAAAQADWAPLFEAAGLRPADWTPAEPDRIPLVSFDELASWTGAFPHAPSVPIRIDAAAWRGRPVHFLIRGPWNLPAGIQRPQTAAQRAAPALAGGLIVVVFVVAAFVAFGHQRRARGDAVGAWRLAMVAFVSAMVEWLLGTHHVASAAEQQRLGSATSEALFVAAVSWVLYMALEPYVRRRWPQSLISWTRLLRGGLRDPVVAGHVLVGTTLGVGYTVFFAIRRIAEATGGVPPASGLATLLGPVQTLGLAAGGLGRSVVIALFLFFLFFLVRALLRRTWLAGTVVVAIAFLVGLGQPTWVGPVFSAVQIGLGVLILVRFGVLAMVLAIFVSSVLPTTPMTTDFSAWYASSMFTALAIVLAITAWSFRAALGGRAVWNRDLLEG